jgi:hypothetical protein
MGGYKILESFRSPRKAGRARGGPSQRRTWLDAGRDVGGGAGLDPGVVSAGGDPSRGERRDRELPLPAAADAAVRRGHAVLLGWAAVPGAGQVDYGAGDEEVLRGQGLSTYTYVSDQHSTFGTKVIVVTRREAQYVLDEIMGTKTDLPIIEHATDTHGVTLVNFALFDLVAMQLSPRIRDLGKIALYRMDPQRDVSRLWPVAGPLLTQKINMGLIGENWDDLLRLAASIKFGHATASLIVGKLSAFSRQNTLAGQTEQAWCLTVLTNSVVTWTTEYYGLAVAQMSAAGQAVDDELLAHISPAHSENVNYHGTINVEVDTELGKLDPAGYRPRRARRLGSFDSGHQPARAWIRCTPRCAGEVLRGPLPGDGSSNGRVSTAFVCRLGRSITPGSQRSDRLLGRGEPPVSPRSTSTSTADPRVRTEATLDTSAPRRGWPLRFIWDNW